MAARRFDIDTDGALVRASGEIDAEAASKLWRALNRASRTGDAVRIDMSGVSFLDSNGLRVMLSVRESLEILVVNPSHQVRKLFELTGLTERFGLDPVDDSAPPAVQSNTATQSG